MSIIDAERDLQAKHGPQWRIYNGAEIEGMRSSLAGYGIALSTSQSEAAVADEKLRKVQDLADELRAAKNYELADRLRAVLTA